MGKSSIYNQLFGGLNMKGGAKMGNLIKLMYEKKEFLNLVFANLIAQLGITYYVMERTSAQQNNLNISIWSLFLAQLIIIFVMALVPIPESIKFLLFCFFSYTFGLMLSVLKNKYSSDIINVAIQGALTVFAFMLATGVALFAGGINLGYKFGSILFWSLLALIVARLVLVLGAKMNQAYKILSFIGIILFAIYVLYDTNKILQRDYYGDVITASMDYYLDILNLFTNFIGSNNN